MKYDNIYKLSLQFAPPKVNLRDAQILDDYGDEFYAKLRVHHSKPENVTREEFDYYGWVYPFMHPTDLLFYLYPILIEYEKDKMLDCVDSFMYSMDRELDGLRGVVGDAEMDTIRDAFQLIWEIGGDDYADFDQCENIQKLLGLL